MYDSRIAVNKECEDIFGAVKIFLLASTPRQGKVPAVPESLGFLQNPDFSRTETPLLRLLRQHGFHPTSQISSSRLGSRRQLVFRRATSPKSRKLSEALMDAFRQAKAGAIRARAAR